MNPILHGVMAYETVASAKRAKEKWDFIVHTLQDGYEFDLRLWKFDALRIPELRTAAVHDATQAQLIFVVTQGQAELPTAVKVWLDQGLAPTNSKARAARMLMFLVDPPTDPLASSAFSQFAYLQQAARRSAMDFMVSPTPPARPPRVPALKPHPQI